MAYANGVTAMAMQGSSSTESYAQRSSLQNRNFHAVGKPVLEKAVEQLLCNLAARTHEAANGRTHIAIADLGCSFGPNTLDCAKAILGALQRNWAADQKMPEIQYLFSDLPSNDFNALFQSLRPFQLPASPGAAAGNGGTAAPPSLQNGAPTALPKIYAAGVPGSFHGRLVPSASLDFVSCSYALQWLSQVPPSVLDKSSPAWNGGRPWIQEAPKDVVDAYSLQSRTDVTNFLKSRAQELVSGGVMFLFIGSSSNLSKNGTLVHDHGSRWEMFNCAWKELVNEGVITMEEYETFNMPMYFFKEHELKDILTNVPEFKVLHMETIEENLTNTNLTLSEWVDSITSVTKPTVESHVSKEKSNKIYEKFDILASKRTDSMVIIPHVILVATLQRL